MLNIYNNDLPQAITKGVIAIDTEAMGLQTKRDRLCLVQIADSAGEVSLIKFDKDYNAPNLKASLENSNVEKIFHYARFDVAILQYYLNCQVQNIYCTKIASKIARTYSQKHGLKYLCKELLKVDFDKYEQSSYWGNDELSKAQHKYAANDVLYLHGLKEELNYILQREGRYELAIRAMSLLSVTVELDLADFLVEEVLVH